MPAFDESRLRRTDPRSRPAARQTSAPADGLPTIDYARHPAYGACFGPPSAALRLRALAAFGRGLTIAGLRALTDFEHLPKPSGRPDKVRWMLARSAGYLRLIVQQRLRRRRADVAVPAPGGPAADVLARLQGDGVLALDFGASRRQQLAELLAPHFRELDERLSRVPPAERRFDDSRLVLRESVHPQPYAWFREALGRLGVLEAARAFLGRPVDVAHVVPQVNTPQDDFWGHPFDDIGLPAQRCDYFHVDTAYRVVKLIVYIGPVDRRNGPFSFVRGSHRPSLGTWDGLCRRANDYAGLSSTRRAARERFTALPAVLRRKAAFGPDLLDEHPAAARLLDGEWVIGSDEGCCIVFDPQGVHRGGMVQSGRRKVVSIMLAESPNVPGFD